MLRLLKFLSMHKKGFIFYVSSIDGMKDFLFLKILKTTLNYNGWNKIRRKHTINTFVRY